MDSLHSCCTFFWDFMVVGKLHDFFIITWINRCFPLFLFNDAKFVIAEVYLEGNFVIMAWCAQVYLHHYFNYHVCVSIHPSNVRPSQKNNFAQSTKVSNKCCCICFSDEKYPLGITSWPPGPRGAPLGHLRGQTKSWSNEKKLLTKVVKYVSVMKKSHHSPAGWPPA